MNTYRFNRYLMILAAAIAFSLTGFVTFGLHPDWTILLPYGPEIFSISFSWFARAQVVLSAAIFCTVLWKTSRWNWLPASLVIFFLGWLSEHIGTGTGLPFGEYGYTSLLGIRLGERVPVLIPTSWFFMMVSAYALTFHRFPRPGISAGRILFAAALVTIWDLVLDPAMSRLAPYWLWAQEGPYYGMPLINLFGWFSTGIVLATCLEVMKARSWVRKVSPRWFAAFYGLNVLLPFGMCLAAGYWGAIAAHLAATGICWIALEGVHLTNGDKRDDLASLQQKPLYK